MVVDWCESVACGLMDMLNGLETFSCGCELIATLGKSAASLGYGRICIGGSNAGAVYCMAAGGWCGKGLALIGRRAGGGIIPFVSGGATGKALGGAGDCVEAFSALTAALIGEPECALLEGRSGST